MRASWAGLEVDDALGLLGARRVDHVEEREEFGVALDVEEQEAELAALDVVAARAALAARASGAARAAGERLSEVSSLLGSPPFLWLLRCIAGGTPRAWRAPL